MKKSGGFTLIEIAIVTVIVGLLLGGILRGQEMVVQARTKNIVNDFTGISASVLAYQDRYKGIPGDDLNAASRWAGAKNGNGDGLIGGKYNDPAPSGDPAVQLTISPATGAGESLNAWWHLRMSGFVIGPQSGVGAATQPINAAGGILGVQSGQGPANWFGGMMACASNVPDQNATGVDTQLDDTQPQFGQVRALKQPAGLNNPDVDNAALQPQTVYVEDGGRYLVCRSL